MIEHLAARSFLIVPSEELFYFAVIDLKEFLSPSNL